MTTLIGDTAVAAVPAADNGEPLVHLASFGITCSDDTSAYGRHVRLGVAERLAAAQRELPTGVRFLVTEAARPVLTQQRIITRYLRELRLSYPGVSAEELQRLSTRYVAPLDVAPHVAGAAVDLTLLSAGGTELWMGCELDATPEQSGGACAFDAVNINDHARRNRRLLAEVLTGAGLVNYPTEWWHWSYGDRYWAHVTGAGHALYEAPRLAVAA